MATWNEKYSNPAWIGQKFGRLTVLGVVNKRDEKGRTHWLWNVKCDCGTEKTVNPRDLITGTTKSCGCYHDEVCAKRATKYRHSIYEYKRLHGIWHGIRKRCLNVNSPRYKDYGGRGIAICEEWKSLSNGFDNFVDWALSSGYTGDMTIERIDVNGNYSPENCKWISLNEQRLNKRTTLWVEYRGEKVRLHDLAEKSNVSYDTLHDRIYKRGWDVERAVNEPSVNAQKSFSEKCREVGIKPQTARDRIKKLGWTEERALHTPSAGRGANQQTYK